MMFNLYISVCGAQRGGFGVMLLSDFLLSHHVANVNLNSLVFHY